MAVSTARVLFCSSIILALFSSASAQTKPENWGTNTPGVTLVAHEGPREKSSQGTILLYNLIGKGFPSDVAYVLWGCPAGKEPKLLTEGVSFDQRGVLVCSGRPGFCKGKGPDDPVNIQTTAAPGEMKRFAVVSRDGRVAGFADAVPFPR